MPALLVVDDDKDILESIKESLRLELPDLVIQTARSGTDALERLRARDFDLVLSDVQMPKMTGFELMEVMADEFPDIRVVLMSGDSFERSRAIRKGALHILPKPFPPKDLINLVKNELYGPISR